MKLSLLPILSLLALAASCTPANNPTDAGDGAPPPPGPAAACSAMCATLRKIPCPEGRADAGTACEDSCMKVQANHSGDLKPLCVADAGSAEAVRACGTMTCQ